MFEPIFSTHTFDDNTGEIKKGTTNAHWYQLGISKIFSTPWLSEHNVTHHPDTGVPITGLVIPNMKEMMDFVREAHLRLIPHVPLCGWDVAFTENHGAFCKHVVITPCDSVLYECYIRCHSKT